MIKHSCQGAGVFFSVDEIRKCRLVDLSTLIERQVDIVSDILTHFKKLKTQVIFVVILLLLWLRRPDLYYFYVPGGNPYWQVRSAMASSIGTTVRALPAPAAPPAPVFELGTRAVSAITAAPKMDDASGEGGQSARQLQQWSLTTNDALDLAGMELKSMSGDLQSALCCVVTLKPTCV